MMAWLFNIFTIVMISFGALFFLQEPQDCCVFRTLSHDCMRLRRRTTLASVSLFSDCFRKLTGRLGL